MPLTQKQLVKNTPLAVKQRSKICSIRPKQQGKYVKNKKLGNVFEIIYKTRCLDGDHLVTLRYVGKSKPGLTKNKPASGIPSNDSELWVSCDCKFFLFNVEYALAKHKSSDIIYSNGKRPVVKNPKEIAYLCKHVLLAVETAIKDYKKMGPLQEALKKVWREPISTKVKAPKKQVIPEDTLNKLRKDLDSAEKNNDLNALDKLQKAIDKVKNTPSLKKLKPEIEKVEKGVPARKDTVKRFRKVFDAIEEFNDAMAAEESKEKKKKDKNRIPPGLSTKDRLERFRKIKEIPSD